MEFDDNLNRAVDQVTATLRKNVEAAEVKAFFNPPTFTVTYVIHDPATKIAAIIDSVMEFDPSSGRTSFGAADEVIDYVRAKGLTVEWLLETHAHADHLTAAQHLKAQLGGKIAIGREIRVVQDVFGKIFNEGHQFARDGSQFDRLFADGDSFAIGTLPVIVLHVPGHTPADMAFIVGDAAFVGDTMFMPDYGTARADFPGGNAGRLYRSIRRLMKLPTETRAFLCHDYKAPKRDVFVWETTIGAEKKHNIHVHEGVTESDFVAMRTKRDITLELPRLILPSIQVNMRGGRLPEPEANGVSYLKIPINQF